MDDAEKLLAGCSIIDSVRNDEAMSMRGRFHHFDLKNSDGVVEGLSNCCTVWLLIFFRCRFQTGGVATSTRLWMKIICPVQAFASSTPSAWVWSRLSASVGRRSAFASGSPIDGSARRRRSTLGGSTEGRVPSWTDAGSWVASIDPRHSRPIGRRRDGKPVSMEHVGTGWSVVSGGNDALTRDVVGNGGGSPGVEDSTRCPAPALSSTARPEWSCGSCRFQVSAAPGCGVNATPCTA